jgi:hypothetical protein
MDMESVVGASSAIAGIAVALGIFIVAWILVARARRGNQKTRDRRHDPHAVFSSGSKETHRDIPQ